MRWLCDFLTYERSLHDTSLTFDLMGFVRNSRYFKVPYNYRVILFEF